jgi:hypothetical protein
MAFAISLWFDEVSEADIREKWQRLHAGGISTALCSGPYRPHITLGIWEQLDLDQLRAQLKPEITTLESFEITLPFIGCISAPPGKISNSGSAVFLGVTPTSLLLSVHELVHAAAGISANSCRQFYKKNVWNPHCTLAANVPSADVPRAVEIAQRFSFPMQVRVDRVGVIETPAEVELDSYELSGGVQ